MRAIVNFRMDDGLKKFLEKFAELERRVRKLAAEDRALKDEVRSLRDRLSSAEAEAQVLRETLEREREARKSARDRLDGLIERLDVAARGSSDFDSAGLFSEVNEVEQ